MHIPKTPTSGVSKPGIPQKWSRIVPEMDKTASTTSS